MYCSVRVQIKSGIVLGTGIGNLYSAVLEKLIITKGAKAVRSSSFGH
jgi:hypothetical protein